jgi:Fe-S cluster assembly iron-binding protein IscA
MLGLESAAHAGDEVSEFEGVRIFVDPFSLPIVHGMTIDFVEGVSRS